MMRVLILIFLVVGQVVAWMPAAKASALNGVVISHVIGGEKIGSSDGSVVSYHDSEFIALYNNSATDVDVTGYCISSLEDAEESKWTEIACIKAEPNVHVFIKSFGYLTISSERFKLNHGYTPDTVYPSGNKITVGGDTIALFAPDTTEVDRVWWESNKLTTGGMLHRKIKSVDPILFLDDNQAADFNFVDTFSDNDYPLNDFYAEETIVDICPNITGVQQVIPGGYLVDVSGDCQPDSCLNIEGLQVSVPDGYESDEDGKCTVVPLVLNELLANVSGSDTGNEFIEIYNPTEQTIDLSLYGIRIGDSDKVYTFPAGETIQPGEYRAFSDTSMKFTLVNSSSRVVLSSVDKTSVFGDSGWYDSPAEDESWALLDGTWQYTNRPTPGAINMPSIILEITEKSELAPCPAGKYRNPLTNRCRNIVSDASVLAACKDGQYRNPETNRCRKIETSNLKPCKDGQYRSEETNRCRNILGASTLKPCKENQYRSEETNRCRNLPGSSNVPEAAFAVKPVAESGTVFIGWWALGGIILLAAGYGVWEWRKEILHFGRRFTRRP